MLFTSTCTPYIYSIRASHGRKAADGKEAGLHMDKILEA